MRVGWLTFRNQEVNWKNVCLIKRGDNILELVSRDGTHIGHNIPDKKGNRFLANLVCIAGRPPNKDGTPITETEVKAYYQWVPFMLFLQAVMFYVPHIIYKAVEGHKLKVTFSKFLFYCG